MSASDGGGGSVDANDNTLSTGGVSLTVVVGDSACWSFFSVANGILGGLSALNEDNIFSDVNITGDVEMPGSGSSGTLGVISNGAWAAIAFALAGEAGIGNSV